MKLAATLLSFAPALAACGDAAVDASFRGRDPSMIFQAVLADDAAAALIAASAGGARGVLWWQAPDGAVFIDQHVDASILGEGECNVFLYAPPPERFLRPAAHGQIALGQLAFYADQDGDGAHDDSEPWLGRPDTLIAWSPEGAGGGLVLGELEPGWHRVVPSVPCDVTPLVVLPLDRRATKPLSLQSDTTEASLFFAPGCADQLGTVDYCPSFAATRWWCRYGPASAEVCDPCEWRIFPEGADAAQCDAWRGLCSDIGAMIGGGWFEECWVEWRVCLAGEPARTQPCDLACACAKLAAHCERPGTTCNAEILAGCNWQETTSP